MTVFEELVDELRVDNLIDKSVKVRQDDAPVPLSFKEDPPPQKAASSDDDGLALAKHRAEDDVSTVQLIEHIFDGIEGDTDRSDSAIANAAEAKKARIKVIQFSGAADDPELHRAQIELERSLKAWKSDLELRDSKIDVSRLRLFCENSRPALSAKSLIALAGLYRTCEFSDTVRDKFDFLMTRLFSLEPNEVRREMRFGRSETIEQIKKLYRKWMGEFETQYIADRDDVNETVAKFRSFGVRIEAAPTFSDLFRSDLPASIREFKKSLGERTFEPEVLASVLECNIDMGNRFVEIAATEKQAYGPDAVRSKYGDAFDQVATESAVRTIRLGELLESADLEPTIEIKPEPIPVEVAVKKPKKERRLPISFHFFGVSKWLLGVAFVTIVAGIGIFFFVEMPEESKAGVLTAKQADLTNTDIGRYFAKAGTSESTFYLVTGPDWQGLTPEEQRTVLRSALDQGRKRGMRTVQLLDDKGNRIGFASDSRTEIKGN